MTPDQAEIFYAQCQWVEASTGRGIFSRTPYTADGTLAGPTFYVGQGNLNVLTEQGPTVVPFEFAIPGTRVDEAFANSHAAFETAKAEKIRQVEAVQQRQAKQLVLPNGQVIPAKNGNPRTR